MAVQPTGVNALVVEVTTQNVVCARGESCRLNGD
jgi:hypothetical protein